MLSVDRHARAGTSVLERRNLLEDFEAVFQETPSQILGVATMTDTDDTGSRSVAYCGDIRFMSEVMHRAPHR